MRRFLYFLPGVNGANDKMLLNAGLGDRFARADSGAFDVVMQGVGSGPRGGGLIVAAGGDIHPTYAPERQQWIEGEKFWVAAEDYNPVPADLLRKNWIGGYEVLLGDGLLWTVPTMLVWDRKAVEHTRSPLITQMKLLGGKVRIVTQDEYAAAEQIAQDAYTAFCNSSRADLSACYAWAVQLLSVNYRIGVEEANLLGLLDAGTIFAVLQASFDLPGIRAHARELEVAQQ